MTSKAKILEALDIALDDVSEDCLLDILLDAYKSKDQAILRLEGENAREREDMHQERERMREEYDRRRSDPLYCTAIGEYYFIDNGCRYRVRVQSGHVSLIRHILGMPGCDLLATPTTRDWK